MAKATRSPAGSPPPSPLKGVPLNPDDSSATPSLLAPAPSRGLTGGGGRGDLDLLSDSFVRVGQAFQLTDGARGGERAVDPLAELDDERVVLVEVEGGGTAITTAAQLRAAGGRLQPPEGATSRGLEGPLAGRLFALSFGDDELIAQAKERLREELGKRLGDTVTQAADLGLSWLGTKVLMGAIEARLPVDPGLYRWNGGEIDPNQRVDAAASSWKPLAPEGLLVFIHGTGSSTQGSFGDLATSAVDTWELLRSHFNGEIYGFEHHTFSQGPIENALLLARALPAEAHLHLVSHSSGGLVADLLCLDTIDDALIERLAYRGAEGGPLGAQLREAQAEQRERLRELRALLARKAFRVGRYGRVACPARGTRLLGQRLDLFLSGLLTLVGLVPPLAGHPVHAVVKRVVLEIARRRTHPALVPGLAALMPDSPLGDVLAQATPKANLTMATIAGDREGSHPLRRLASLLHDALFFERLANDLVVDTASMGAGIAPRAKAHALVERASGVSHFHYFQRPTSSRALGRWMSERQPERLAEFALPRVDLADRERESTRATERDGDAKIRRDRNGGARPPEAVVVLLPDGLASHLWRPAEQKRIWFDPADRAGGGLARLGDLHALEVEAEKVMELIYGDLCRELSRSHRVERFAYDWRQPLDVTAERLAARLRELLSDADLATTPTRLLAHGMGGLVARGMIARDPDLWRRLISRDGARFLMLGTPNQGCHQMVATLLGQSTWIRQLARVDPGMDLGAQLDALAEFPGLLQLLPRPGFSELATPSAADTPPDWYEAALWADLKARNRDPWFGNGLGATPTGSALKKGRWLWDQGPGEPPAIPGDQPERVILVNGQAPSTPCGLVVGEEGLQVLGTSEGDGVVTWRSARIAGIGQTYLMDADHGGLPAHPAAFPALVELLQNGRTALLPTMKSPAETPEIPPTTHPIDAGPVPWPTDEELLRGLVGGQPAAGDIAPPSPSLRVSCHAMDLRFVQCPVMVGHYEQDPIAGAEALIDRGIVAGELSSRERLGLYAGPLGTATVVLMNRGQEELHQGRCPGAVVIGLGTLGGLSVLSLVEAVRVGTLRYLLQIVDRHGGTQVDAANVRLATLLIGQNSTNAISIEDSVGALVAGVLNANAQFARAFPRLSVRVGHLQIVEVFLDAAISATRALRTLAEGRNGDSPALEVEPCLRLGRGWRHRLDAARGAGYWPRLLVLGSEDKPEEGTGTERPRGVTLAEHLRYSYLGDRARAETIHQPRQSGLVEELVAASIHNAEINPDLSRTLFQLLVPTPFKDLARRLDQLVLVLDETTANFPWELLMADDQPMALRLAVVRQLQSPNYRRRVRQTPSNVACVIGNPLTNGFHRVFAGQAAADADALDSLDGASEEAKAVAQILREHNYDVEDSIEEGNGVDVINKLYRRPYRVLHIAAHGVFEQLTRLGDRRTGVVLANGMLITATEIEAMEVVPDLVFLNCCHLGTVTASPPTPYNRLAASVARQLIEMGVRAVVACGWAVNDKAALVFAQTFYGAMLANIPFGEAVFTARKKAQEDAPASNTWGAYQAYGDPAFLLDAPHDTASQSHAQASSPGGRWAPVTPHELIDQLGQLRVRGEETGRAGLGSLEALISELHTLRSTAPASWLQESEVAMALAETTAAMGPDHWEEARRLYEEAIRAHQGEDDLPVRAIERLADLEARQGEARDDEALIRAAQGRIQALLTLVGETPEDGTPREGVGRPAEWFALMGSTHARLAGLRARRLGTGKRPTAQQLGAIDEALEAGAQAYGRAGAHPAHQILRLTLDALRQLPAKEEASVARAAAILEDDLGAGYERQPSFQEGVWAANALLARLLLDGSLGEGGEKGQRAEDALLEAYQTVFLTSPASPLRRASALEHLELLASVSRAKGRSRDNGWAARERASQRLERVLGSLRGEGEGAALTDDTAESEDDGVMVLG